MRPTMIIFEKLYDNGLGIEERVELENHTIKIGFESIGLAEIPLANIDWLIDALVEIKKITQES